MSSFVEPKTPKYTIFITSTRRTPSLSSSPSQSSSNNSSSSFRSISNEEDSSPSSTPPQRIPFSWESIPGIPKHQIIKRIDSSNNISSTKTSSKYLPLPPAASITTTKPSHCKKQHVIRSNDPFFAALVECSKGGVNDDVEEEEDHDHNKGVFGGSSLWKDSAKSLSHRFGFVNFSCKNTCSVAESLVFLPREQPRRISYGLVKKR